MNEIVNKFSLAGAQRHFALHFTSHLSIALSKILPHSETIKNPKRLSIFGENDSRHLSNFLQTHIFSNFDHISRIYNQINYRNVCFPKVIIILIVTAQMLLFNVFSLKDPHLNAVEFSRYTLRISLHDCIYFASL